MLRLRRPPFSLAVVAVIVALTLVLAWAASSTNRSSNDRLLGLQVRQTASVLQNQIPVISAQLLDAAHVAEDTNGDPIAFRRFVGDKISTRGPFLSITLLRRKAGRPQVVTTVGVPPVLSGESADAFFASVRPGRTSYLTPVLVGSHPGRYRFGYAALAPEDTEGLIVYAERLLPPRRRITLPANSPFAGLQLAVYLGRGAQEGQLLESTGPTPIRGRTHTEIVRFGDSALTVVGASPQQLAGRLSAALPWIVLALGLTLSVAAGRTSEYIARKRELAEKLARENERLFHQQRDIAVTLQHALLPELPSWDHVGMRSLEVAARYLPSGAGTEVGGDWYDVVPDDQQPGRTVFVVGDVSGHGLAAAASMAAMRFAIRAYLAQGDDIATVLGKLDQLLPFEHKHQFATVLMGELDLRAGRLRLVSAGHFAPLLVIPEGTRFQPCAVRPPVGVDGTTPAPVSYDLTGPGTLVAFTDGLIERPGELLDLGLKRLQKAVEASSLSSLQNLVDDLIPANTEDDAVILGLRWSMDD